MMLNGEIVDNVYVGDALRTNVEYGQLSENLIDAFVSIEDKTFFEHNGFNIVRIFGAIWERGYKRAKELVVRVRLPSSLPEISI